MNTISDQLNKAQPGQFITFTDGSRAQVLGRITWCETQDKGPTGRNFTLVALGDGRLIAEVPEKEGGAVRWFDLIKSDGHTTDEVAPYAKRFGQGGQKVTVTLEFDGVNYRLTDIGAETFTTDGEAFLTGNGKCRHIVGKSDAGDYFLFVDLTEGDGQDALFIGCQIDPEDAIQGIE